MRNTLTLVILLLLAVSTQAQVSERIEIRPGDLFKKKNKKGRGDSNMPYVDNARPDERTKYFFETVLPKGDTSKMNEFLATGININVTAKEGGSDMYGHQTILMYALDKCSIGTIEYLLKHGADPNLRIRQYWEGMFGSIQQYRYSRYPLEVVAYNGDMDKMQLLINYGADIDRCIKELNEIATKKGNTELMTFLSQKTGVNAIPKNALAVMTDHSYEHDASKVTPATIRELLKKGVDINAYSPHGKTALINVIQNKQIRNKAPLIKELILNGVDLNKPDRVSDGYGGANKYYPSSPLKIAVKMGSIDLVKQLVEAGADVKGYNLLEYAKSDEIKEYLILNGAK